MGGGGWVSLQGVRGYIGVARTGGRLGSYDDDPLRAQLNDRRMDARSQIADDLARAASRKQAADLEADALEAEARAAEARRKLKREAEKDDEDDQLRREERLARIEAMRGGGGKDGGLVEMVLGQLASQNDRIAQMQSDNAAAASQANADQLRELRDQVHEIRNGNRPPDLKERLADATETVDLAQGLVQRFSPATAAGQTHKEKIEEMAATSEMTAMQREQDRQDRQVDEEARLREMDIAARVHNSDVLGDAVKGVTPTMQAIALGLTREIQDRARGNGAHKETVVDQPTQQPQPDQPQTATRVIMCAGCGAEQNVDTTADLVGCLGCNRTIEGKTGALFVDPAPAGNPAPTDPAARSIFGNPSQVPNDPDHEPR